MKKLIIAATLAVTTIVHAELTPQQFGQARDWANREGYIYHGIETSAGVRVFMFENPTSSALACAPVSSDTADEAINALIGSAALYRCTVVVARQTLSEERKEAYRQGVVAVKQLTEQAYRQGYIDGSQLRREGAIQ